MALLREIRNRARNVVAPTLCSMVIAYFGYHLVQGDRGLRAWIQVRHEIAVAEKTLGQTETERNAYETRVARLRPDQLDLDMLDEQARVILNMAKPEDLVILERPD
jgi:cell division protein FtsB